MSRVGESYLVGLIGEGVLPSLTPPLHEAEADAQGLRYLYRPIDLAAAGRTPSDLAALLDAAAALGFSAVNVTHPCKRDALPLLDEVSPAAAAIGAVNTVLFEAGRRIGHNTDVTGFGSALGDGLPDADLTDVVVVGAGGAGAAVAHALVAAGAGRLTIADLDPARAAELAAALAGAAETGAASSGAETRIPATAIAPDALPAALATATGVVNATFAGMHSHPGLPFDPALLRPALWVADVVYRPLETELVLAARAAGCRVLDGGGMAVGQAADAFRLITGREPDRARMRAHFAALIAQGL